MIFVDAIFPRGEELCSSPFIFYISNLKTGLAICGIALPVIIVIPVNVDFHQIPN